MSSLQKAMLRSKLPPLPPKLDSNLRKGTQSRPKDYTPALWNDYFTERRDVKTKSGTFRIYFSAEPAKPGPTLVLLHGGGFSALTWAHFSTEITSLIHCRCLAIDLRGHGDTHTDNDLDLSAETLATDVGDVLTALYGDDAPQIVLIGHSMGGAICVHIGILELIPTLIGAVVIDVVEGTALEALASMQSFLRSRPTYFKSIEHAIEWSVRSGQIRNAASARVSMPGQIVNCATGALVTNEISEKTGEKAETKTDEPKERPKFADPLSIPEDGELDTSAPPPAKFQAPADTKKYTWRIDLSKSERFWNGWFEGLSEKFLNLRVPKLLLLAGIDNLDKTLQIGQMQGKFQMQVLARCGHAVHEDVPHEVAEVIGSYLLRNRFVDPIGTEFNRVMPSC